jgi:hypothetical protein
LWSWFESAERGSCIAATLTLFTAYVLVSWPKASLGVALLARAQEDAEWYDEVKGTMVVRGLAKKQ